ncbi:MAG TPA: hypothetical protein VGF02_04370 [Pseudolabrys sp.]|jgi:hypothetical protein
MDRQTIGRLISVLAGAAILFGLEQGVGMKFYFAVPVAVVVYVALRLALQHLWGADDKMT